MEVNIEDIIKEIIRIDVGQIISWIAEIEDNLGKTEVETDLSKAIGETIGKIQEIMEDKTVEESIGITLIEMTIMIEVGIGLEKGHFPGTMAVIELGVQSIVDWGQGLEPVQIEIRCYKCREYNHFARECPTSREEREIEQLQQMLDLEENQNSLSTNSQNSSVENARVSPSNLWMVGMVPLHSYLSIPE